MRLDGNTMTSASWEPTETTALDRDAHFGVFGLLMAIAVVIAIFVFAVYLPNAVHHINPIHPHPVSPLQVHRHVPSRAITV
jgi:hypothetical protein